MKGRLEHELRIKNTINNLLADMPDYVSDFYYNLQISKEPSTCLEYIRKIKAFLNFANRDIELINDRIIGEYFEQISYTIDSHGEIRKTSFAHKQSTWSALNQFFIYLQRKHIVQNNPVQETSRPPKKDKVNRVFLSFEDLNAILETVKNGAGSHKAVAKQREWVERDILILFLFMNTGMRKTALSEINIEDISFENETLIVIDKRNKHQEYSISADMKKTILEWLTKREKLLAGEKCDALFISSLRKRMSERAIYNLVKKYSEEALGYSISPHKLRAAFVSLYYEATGDIKATCEAVGHADIATTSIYITQRNDSRKAAQSFMSQNLKLENN